MSRETRIGLLVGLMFIVLFGLVLSELTGDSSKPAKPETQDANGLVQKLSIEGLPQVDMDHIDYVEDVSAAEPKVVQEPAEQLTAEEQATTLPLLPKATILADDTLAETAAPMKEHVVASGESLCDIAKRYYGKGALYTRIYEANKDILPNAATLSVGQKLQIPSLPDEPAAPQTVSLASRTEPVKDVAARGAMDGVSRRQVSVGYEELTIKQLENRVKESDKAGTKAKNTDRVYTVKRGDTLSGIALKCLGSKNPSAVRRIFQVNKKTLSSPDQLHVGMKLIIPS